MDDRLPELLAFLDAQRARQAPHFPTVKFDKVLSFMSTTSVAGSLAGVGVRRLVGLEAACERATATTLYKARAQAANSPLAYRNSAEFKRFALAEFDKFKKLVAENGLQER